MFNSLSDYLQQQRDRDEALKRKLSQLKPTVALLNKSDFG